MWRWGGVRASHAIQVRLCSRCQLHLRKQALPAQECALRLHEGLQLLCILVLCAGLPKEQHRCQVLCLVICLSDTPAAGGLRVSLLNLSSGMQRCGVLGCAILLESLHMQLATY